MVINVSPTLLASVDQPIDGVQYTVEFQSNPFAEGVCHFAFRGVYAGGGPNNGKKCVVKICKCPRHRSVLNYETDQATSLKAQEWAIKFNAERQIWQDNPKPVKFIVPRKATLTNAGQQCQYGDVGDTVLVEDYIEGCYEKFNTNTGTYPHTVSTESETAQEFAHFTYAASEGREMVCDVQGVRSETGGYILTDPAVHSERPKQFGPTDLGEEGKKTFFSKHICTLGCMRLPRPAPSDSPCDNSTDGDSMEMRHRVNISNGGYSSEASPESSPKGGSSTPPFSPNHKPKPSFRELAGKIWEAIENCYRTICCHLVSMWTLIFGREKTASNDHEILRRNAKNMCA